MADARLAAAHLEAREQLQSIHGRAGTPSPDELVPSVTEIARRRPWAWVGAGVLLGVLLDRGRSSSKSDSGGSLMGSAASWLSLARVAAQVWPGGSGAGGADAGLQPDDAA